MRLAHLYDATGDWPKAQLKYRELELTTRNSKDLETLNLRLFYLAQYIDTLLQHREPDDEEGLKTLNNSSTRSSDFSLTPYGPRFSRCKSIGPASKSTQP